MPSPSAARRSASRAAARRGFFLLQLRSGRLGLQQYGRECVVEPGDSVLIDRNGSYRLECLGKTRSVAVRFSHDWLKNWVPGPERLTAKPIRPDGVGASVLFSALATLDSTTTTISPCRPAPSPSSSAASLALAVGPGDACAHAERPSC